MPLLVLVCLAVLWLAPAARAAPVPSGARAAPAAAAAAGAAARWVAPVTPLLVRRAFAPPATTWGAGHRGVDLAAYAGTPVRAAGAGRVTFAGVLAGRGVVVVTHGTLRTTYEPVRPLLAVGDAVAAGEAVALLRGGHAGPARAGEALLHWGLLRGDRYLDPLSLLARGPSRLVPVAPGPAGARPPEKALAPLVAAPRDTPGGAAAAAAPPRDAVPRPDAPPPGGGPWPAPVTGAALAVAAAGITAVSRRSRGSP